MTTKEEFLRDNWISQEDENGVEIKDKWIKNPFDDVTAEFELWITDFFKKKDITFSKDEEGLLNSKPTSYRTTENNINDLDKFIED